MPLLPVRTATGSGGVSKTPERGSIAGRCINFARQGMVAFSYDMVGYNDSDQLVHREIGGRREALWGNRRAELAIVEQHSGG